MEDVVIRAEGLGKKYLIGHQVSRNRHVTLRDMLGDAAREFLRSLRAMARGDPIIAGDEIEEFWSLKDLDFEIRRGDVVGVIGRNGAGKSTLLKILSRVTEPSAGRVSIRGRVSSLLEVGTGFHPELTGRENIFLNGAILGMTRTEIRRRFDEIVAFAEIERFLDTPVKRYSSGMYVRLAFAIAAHLEPEILVVDEVLAVGDTEFQRKCLGAMSNVASHGRTVFFVSHSIPTIRRLCSSAIYLKNGRILANGPTHAVCDVYLTEAYDAGHKIDLSNITVGSHYIEFARAWVHGADGDERPIFGPSDDVFISIVYKLTTNEVIPVINFHVFRGVDNQAFASINNVKSVPLQRWVRSTLRIPKNFLNCGQHFITIFASSFNPDVVHAQFENALSFDVLDDPNSDTREGYLGPFPGVVRPLLQWSLAENDSRSN